MKRDLALIRRILLHLEGRSTVELAPIDLEGEEETVIDFHGELLVQAGLIEATHIVGNRGYDRLLAKRLTWEGYEFLDAVRDPGIMAKAMEKARPLGGIPLDVLKALAVGFVKDAVGLGGEG